MIELLFSFVMMIAVFAVCVMIGIAIDNLKGDKDDT